MPRVPAEISRDGRRLRRMHIQLIAGIPLERKMYYATRLGDFFQRPQSGTQHLELARRIPWQAQCQPEGMLDGCNSRRSHARCKLRHHGKRNRAEAGGFDFTLNQSHGPAANRSNGDQDQRVHLVFAETADNARHAALEQAFRPQGIAHVGIMRLSSAPDLAEGFEFVQSLDGHYAIEILIGEGRVDVQVIRVRAAGRRCPRKNPIRWVGEPGVAPFNPLIERLIGNQSDPG